MAIVTALCICLSVLLVTPSAAMQVHEKQSSHQHGTQSSKQNLCFCTAISNDHDHVLNIIYYICHCEQPPMIKSSSLTSLHCQGNSEYSLIRKQLYVSTTNKN